MFKGKKMAGHLGDERVTVQNLEVVRTDPERGLVLVHGAVPGSRNGWVMVRDAVKQPLPDGVPMPAGILADAEAAAGAEAAEAGETSGEEAGSGDQAGA